MRAQKGRFHVFGIGAAATPDWRGAWFAGIVAIITSGCAVGDGIGAGAPAIGLNCVDDSSHCIKERQSALHELVTSPDRKWIRQKPTPSAYASGVRMFAYKKKKRSLSCEELRMGQTEARGAEASLRSPAAADLTPAQISRGTMFAREVGRELQREHSRRCKTG